MVDGAPLIRAMGGMIRELSVRPELGFLGGKAWFGRTIVLIQYWRSFEDLEAYARAKDLSHVPAWAAFNRKIGNDGLLASITKPIASGRDNTKTCSSTCPRPCWAIAQP